MDSGLTDDTEFSYTVHASNEVGNSAPSELVVATTFAAPSQPLSVAAQPGRRLREVVVRWAPPASDGRTPVTAYRVLRSAHGGALSRVGADLSPSASSYSDADTDPGTSYTYAVTAVNVVGEGELSATSRD